MTVYAYASTKQTDSTYSRTQASIAVDTTVEGDKVTWVSTVAGADITLAKFDTARASEYSNVKNPLIVVKCTSDSSSTNTLVKSEDGTTLHTFIADHSSAVGYAAFRLVEGSRNTASWRLA